MTVNKDRVELFAAALESDKYRQCKGELRISTRSPDTGYATFHCALGVATQVALDNGLHAELLEKYGPFSGIFDALWETGVLHEFVEDWYGWDNENPTLLLTSPDGLPHEIASANDAGFSFWEIAQAVRAKWLKEEG